MKDFIRRVRTFSSFSLVCGITEEQDEVGTRSVAIALKMNQLFKKQREMDVFLTPSSSSEGSHT